MTFVAVLAALAACHQPAPSSMAVHTTSAEIANTTICPLAVPGSQLVAEQTPTGALLQFTTSGTAADVSELRHRVHALVARGAIEPGAPSFRLEVRDSDAGARLVVRADDGAVAPSQLDALRARVWDSTARLARGECVRVAVQ
jgi:hypothetical protein